MCVHFFALVYTYFECLAYPQLQLLLSDICCQWGSVHVYIHTYIVVTVFSLLIFLKQWQLVVYFLSLSVQRRALVEL